MALSAGTRIGPYEVTGSLGAGGMGEVYRATDTNLKRAVAIKVLPEAVASDAERLARFQREAEVLASLNHPNIAAIHGLERSGGTTALVMELVEGPTLADRITEGPIPVDEALQIAKQIAEALEAAHEQGIIHRDLKPANIKLRPDGTVKVLDFGLAKALQPSGGSVDVTASPTITSPAMTQMGVILGTAAYMSPEQARGKAVDKRSDIWAFGCVLYEMLTGQRAFAGEDITDTLAAVVKLDPKWDAVGADVPARVRQAMRVCLQRDLRQRAQAIGDVRLTLEGAFETTAPPSSAPRGRVVWTTVVAVAAMAIIALAIPALRHLRETPPSVPPETRTEIVTPQTTDPMSFAISPDSLQIVFAAAGEGKQQLWLRPLASETPQPLVGTEGALYPFWSPDSKSIAFFAENRLLRLDLGGTPQLVTATKGQGRGGTWSVDGTILFSAGPDEPLSRVPASGGAVETITKLEPGQSSHRFPQFLPDGRRFLYFAQDGRQGVFLGSLDSVESKFLTQASAFGRFAAGRLFWAREGTLVAQPLDVGRAELIGNVTTVANTVATGSITAAAAFSTSSGGTVAYRPGGLDRHQLQWFNRAGQQVGAIGDPDPDNLSLPSLAPDGRRVAVRRTVQGNTDVWILDGTRASRFTFDPASDDNPVWSSDGTRIAFARHNKSGIRDLYIKSAGGAAAEELLLQSADDKSPTAWFADDSVIVFNVFQPDRNIGVLPMAGTRMPWLFLKGKFEERMGQISPDGRWMTYQSNESGRSEIYVRPFTPQPANGAENGSAASDSAQWQISTQGGIYPRWRSDSRELYYIGQDGGMMAASIKTGGTTLDAGTPVKLFDTRIRSGGADVGQGRQYDISRDGRFLINSVIDSAAAPITLLMNWNPDSR